MRQQAGARVREACEQGKGKGSERDEACGDMVQLQQHSKIGRRNEIGRRKAEQGDFSRNGSTAFWVAGDMFRYEIMKLILELEHHKNTLIGVILEFLKMQVTCFQGEI